MVEMKKLSIIVPVYNAQKYLKDCLNSILRIKEKELEVIIVDDGSTDESGRICDEYAKRDERVKVIHQKNSGVSSARNKGISIAVGEWILFVDSDDCLLSNFEQDVVNKLDLKYDLFFYHFTQNEKQLFPEKLENSSAHICNKEEIKIIQRGLLNQDDKKYCELSQGTIDFVSPWGCVLKRKVIQEIKFPEDIYWSEDRIFKFQVLNHVENAIILPGIEYFYRSHGESITHKYKKDIMFNLKEMCKLMLKVVNKKKKQNYRKLFDVFVVRQWLYCMQSGIYHSQMKMKKKDRKNEVKRWRNEELFIECINSVQLRYIKKRQIKIAAFCLKYRLYNMLDCLYLIQRRLNAR